MKILVTGASGFTGKHFAEHAIKNGHEIFPLKSDLTDLALLKEEVSLTSPDAVVHLAAISFVGHEFVEDFYRVNVIGTMNLLNSLVELGLKNTRVLVASSANVYGTPDVEVIDEGICPSPVNHYAASKLAMEYMVKTFYDMLPIVITRPFNYTGVGQSESFLIPKIVSHFRRKDKIIELGNLDVYRDFSDVRDVVKSYLDLLESSTHSTIVNVCKGESISLRDVISNMKNISGHEIEIQVNPKFVRVNEITRLVGSNMYLKKLIGFSPKYTIEDTLISMYES